MKKKKKIFKVNIFWKFVFAICMVVFIYGSINEYIISTNVKELLENEYQRRGVYLVKHLTSECVLPLLVEDYMFLNEEINLIKDLDSTILYVFILDKSNNLIFHTFKNYFPLDLKYANISHSNNLSIKHFKVKNKDEIILDLAMPILDGKLGTLRLGLSEKAILIHTKESVRTFRIMVLFFLLFGIFCAFVFSNLITKPIQRLQYFTENIDIKSLSASTFNSAKVLSTIIQKTNFPIQIKDEIDDLTEKFSSMIIRLEKAQSDIEKTQRNLIHTEKLATLGQMSASLAHEINNPLAGIKNCIKRLNDDSSNLVQNLEYLKLMDRAVEKIEHVSKDYLNFSRFDDVNFENCSINELVKNALLLVSHRLDYCQVSINVLINPPDLYLFCSARHFEQVLINIIFNAIDSIEEKALLKPGFLKKIELNIFTVNNSIVVKISDTGNGIEKEKIETIFDPFFTTKDKSKGTGLGLSIVTSILNLHDAEITAESEIGVGSTFTINFPNITS